MTINSSRTNTFTATIKMTEHKDLPVHGCSLWWLHRWLFDRPLQLAGGRRLSGPSLSSSVQTGSRPSSDCPPQDAAPLSAAQPRLASAPAGTSSAPAQIT